jgi:hypothetical protein
MSWGYNKKKSIPTSFLSELKIAVLTPFDDFNIGRSKRMIFHVMNLNEL